MNLQCHLLQKSNHSSPGFLNKTHADNGAATPGSASVWEDALFQ